MMHIAARRLLDALLAVALAPVCAACRAPLDQPIASGVCPACWRAVLEIPLPSCTRVEGGLIEWSAALGLYEGVLREILHALKYRGRRTLARELGVLLCARAGSILSDADAAVPVPLHWWRHWRRGFNQSAALAECLGLPVVHALRRIRHTSSQTGLDARERQANVRRAFRLRRGISVAGTCLVLVDDVSTTGATLEACARELRKHGAREIRALTAARVATRQPRARPA